MKALIRLLLMEQSDLGLHCLLRPICPNTLEFGGKYVFCTLFRGLSLSFSLHLHTAGAATDRVQISKHTYVMNML